MRSLFGITLTAVLASSCVHSYASAPTLTFKDFKYQSTTGVAWPQTTIELPKVGARYTLGNQNHVSVIELNPAGEKTLLFLHGLGSYVSFWRFQLDVFAAQGYHVVAFDQLGYGKSDKPALFPYTMESMAEVVDEVMEVMHLEHATLIGHSMGGEVAMDTAIRFPSRVEKLVLTSPAGFEPFSVKEKQWFHTAVNAVFVKATPEYGIWGSIRASNFMRWRDELEFLIEERVRVVKSKEFDSYAYAQVRSINGLAHNDFVRDNLERITAPTLILFGEDDRLIPSAFLHGGRARTWMTYGSEHITGSKLEGFSNCGHTVQMDCPEEYNSALTAFLQSP
jgi:pimeloyl-ACP methyl ester carboxylesterase